MMGQLLKPFVDFTKPAGVEAGKETAVPAISEEKVNMPVEELDLSVRTLNSLRRGGITSVGELLAKSEKDLLSLRNFGQKSMQEVQDKLISLGLNLAGQEEQGEGETAAEESGTESEEKTKE
jgi:DNA-directed RNA polymerase subunit alpha